MVRVKHRYLVAQILYPEATIATATETPKPTTTTKATTTTSSALLEFHRPTPPEITPAHLIRLIRETIATVFGDAGAGLCAGSLALKYFSATTSTFIVRCARDRARMVWAALTLITNLPAVSATGKYLGVGGGATGGSSSSSKGNASGKGCVIRVLRCSGTIRKCEERIVELARRDILRVRGSEQKHANELLDSLFGESVDKRAGLDALDGETIGDAAYGIDEDEDEDDEGFMSDKS